MPLFARWMLNRLFHLSFDLKSRYLALLSKYPRARRSATLVPCSLLFLSCLTGCSGDGRTSTTSLSSSGGTPSSAPANPDASGNWQFDLTASNGPTLISSLSGYVKDDVTDTTASKYASAELVASAPSGCFTGRTPIFSTGSVTGTTLNLSSLSINGQTLALYGTLDSSSSMLMGTYTVQGGCADQASGTFTAVRYNKVSGSYGGSLANTSGPATIQVSLSQNTYGNGNGAFLITGSVTVTGLSCFASGTVMSPDSYVSGNSIYIAIASAGGNGREMILQGTIDTAADSITVPAVVISGTTCSGSYGSVVLTH